MATERNEMHDSIIYTFIAVGEFLRRLQEIATGNNLNNFWWDEPLTNLNTREKAFSFEWWHKERKLTVYIDKDAATYITSEGESVSDELLCPPDFKPIWEWLAKN